MNKRQGRFESIMKTKSPVPFRPTAHHHSSFHPISLTGRPPLQGSLRRDSRGEIVGSFHFRSCPRKILPPASLTLSPSVSPTAALNRRKASSITVFGVLRFSVSFADPTFPTPQTVVLTHDECQISCRFFQRP